ncbi:MAG: hypothetical protein LBH93_04060, partial [Chitinispirillales bacterium]|nr:hypothetical protein [Chitinispirillales bacterium]
MGINEKINEPPKAHPDRKADPAQFSLNREFKDSIFRCVFGNEKEALELYNALAGTHYAPGT